MRVVVTGAAGFVGSHVAEALVAAGHAVVGVDCFTPYYERTTKEANLAALLATDGLTAPTDGPAASAAGAGAFTLAEVDLRSDDLADHLDGADVVVHQAAQPGIRLSWSDGFATYDACNVLATQRLLEACVGAGVGRVVFASSSSVYGRADRFPVVETDLPAPHSPYGVTKLAAEHLCGLYGANHGLSTVSLRYFTVYGPRQRPDMAFHRMVEAALDASEGRDVVAFPRFGDGHQVRDFTFVGDVVRANLAALDADVAPGTVVNVAGGGATVLADVLDAVGDAVGHPVPVDPRPAQPGDVPRTGGSNEAAGRLLGWAPETSLVDGIAAQVAWHRARRADPAGAGS